MRILSGKAAHGAQPLSMGQCCPLQELSARCLLGSNSMLDSNPFEALIHVTDWLPTLISAAGGAPNPDNIDGIDYWDVFKNGLDESPRKTLLYNINPSWYGEVNGAIREGRYKLIIGDPGRVSQRVRVPVTADTPLLYSPPPTSEDISMMANWEQLFDLDQDPTESKDIAAELPGVVERLLERFG